MSAYLVNRWIRIGLALVLFGWGPLLAIIVLAGIGLWPDPDPNPIGPGLLFFLTCWPAIGCLVVGVIQVRRSPPRPAGEAGAARRPHRAAVDQPWSTRLAGLAWVRLFALLGGAGLCLYGAATLRTGSSRGPAASIVLGVVAVCWGLSGRVPSWFRR